MGEVNGLEIEEETLRKMEISDFARYIPDTSLPIAAMLDMDGTEVFGPHPFDPEATYTPNMPVVRLTQALYQAGYKLVFITARSERYYNETFRWIIRNVAPLTDLLMRPEDDDRKDWRVKYDLFDQKVRNRFNVDIVIDDRERVVAMWRAIGLTCLQPDAGKF